MADGTVMTDNSNFKKRIRAYAAAHDLKYTEARRLLLAAGGAGGSDPTSPVSGGQDDEWDECDYPSVDELTRRQMASWLDRRSGWTLEELGLTPPNEVPAGQYPVLFSVDVDAASFENRHEESYDYADQQLVTGRIEADVQVAYYPEYEDLPAEVVLPNRYRLVLEMGVLCDRAADMSEEQDVAVFDWITEDEPLPSAIIF